MSLLLHQIEHNAEAETAHRQRHQRGQDGAWRGHLFASLRFSRHNQASFGCEAEAKELQRALAARGVQLHIVDCRLGDSIYRTVLETMKRCSHFVAFGW